MTLPRARTILPEQPNSRIHYKDQWLKICAEHPEVLVNASREIDVGPLQALIDELEFNQAVAEAESRGDTGCPFQQAQFLRAIHQGSIAILKDEVRTAIIDAYREMGSTNAAIAAAWQQDVGLAMITARKAAQKRILEAMPRIKHAKDQLLHFLGNAL